MAIRSSVSLISEGLHGLFLGRAGLFFLLFSLHSRNNVVNPQQEAGGLDRGLDHLVLDGNWLEDVDGCHVIDLLGVSINSEVRIALHCVLGAQLGDNSYHVHAAVRCQSLGNDLEGIAN
jgi:hypothetical protein